MYYSGVFVILFAISPFIEGEDCLPMRDDNIFVSKKPRAGYNGVNLQALPTYPTASWVIMDTHFYLRVIEGTPTKIERYPIVAQLLLDAWGDQQFIQHCAGVIVTSRHVLSTAHCFQYNENTRRNYTLPKYWRIRVGSTYRSQGGVIHNIKSIMPHGDFDKHYYTNDIALVMVEKRFIFNNNVRQSTIIKRGVEIQPNSVCTLVGWGVLEADGQQPEQLQHTTLFTVDQNVCKQRYSTIQAVIANSMMCAGRIEAGGPDGCYGDSGGPLIYKGLVVGLVSFGYSCGHRYYPGVYTKISHYTDWIVRTAFTNK